MTCRQQAELMKNCKSGGIGMVVVSERRTPNELDFLILNFKQPLSLHSISNLYLSNPNSLPKSGSLS